MDFTYLHVLYRVKQIGFHDNQCHIFTHMYFFAPVNKGCNKLICNYFQLVDGNSPPQLPSRPTPKLQTNEARYTTLPSYPQKAVENGVPSVPPRKHSSPSSGKEDKH